MLQAGYPGTFALMDVLVDAGRADLAYRLLNHTGVPSWRYAVRLGATTFWERWDSLLADGSLNPGDMLSFNHPVFASITDWMHRVIGGLAPAAPGYRRLRVAPVPGGGLTWARTAHETPYGRAEVAWRLTDEFRLDVVVPPGDVGRRGPARRRRGAHRRLGRAHVHVPGGAGARGHRHRAVGGARARVSPGRGDTRDGGPVDGAGPARRAQRGRSGVLRSWRSCM